MSRLFLLSLLVASNAMAAPLVWYGDAPRAGLSNGSWAVHDLANTTPVHAGTRSIRMEPDNWGGVYLYNNAEKIRFDAHESLTLWVHGGSTGGQRLQLIFNLDGLEVGSFNINTYVSGGAIAANSWRQVTIPFDATTTMTHGGFDGVTVMDYSGSNQGVVYLDDIQFNERITPLPASALTATVNLAINRRPINPDIYGVNFGSDAQHADLRYPVRRSGGNSTTRVNWESDAHNTAFDYFYQNIADGSGSGLPGNSTINQFVDATRAQGADAIVTIPTIGWKPIGDRIKRWGFSIAKYGPQDSNECAIYNPPPSWCSADAGNGECANVVNNTGFCVNGKIVGNAIGDTSVVQTTANIQNWISHLLARPGATAPGVTRMYSLDNEPMLWNSTHRDIHPIAPTYDEVWTRGRDVALAIKSVDPSAQVMGPVTWGWCDLFTSAADAEVGPSCVNGQDRQNHGGMPFVEWYLQQVCSHETQFGVRPVDYLDVHFYPQGNVTGLGGNSDSELPDDAARRLRSLRELYDPAHVSESWIADQVQLLPRLKAWMAARCPSMKLAVTEYKCGPDDGPSGALAQAEVLAIFGREGVDLATRWVAPADGSLAERAFRMYLDYDGQNTRIIGDSVQALSSNLGELGAYAIDQSGDRLRVLLFNRATAPRNITVQLSTALNGAWQIYRFDAAQALAVVDSGTINGNSLLLNAVPGRSATLLVLPSPAANGSVLFGNGFE